MSWTRHIVLVVPSGVLQNSSDVFAILDPDVGGADSFSMPLSADGNEPATHWAAHTILETETLAALALSTTEFKAYLDALADQRGRNQLASAVAFKNSVQISAEDEDLDSFIAGLGLQRIIPPLP